MDTVMELEVIEDPQVDFRTLNALDRCDTGGCSAAANFIAVKNTLELIFCSHHGRIEEPVLISQGFATKDYLWEQDDRN